MEGRKRFIFTFIASLLLVSPVTGADLSVDLRFEPTTAPLPSQGLLSIAKTLRSARIQPFTDKRPVGDTFLGELKISGQHQRIHSKTAVSVFATDAFRKVYGEWGGRVSADSPLLLKGEITQFALEESEGYHARVGFHFYLVEESGRTLWDGHTSGIVKGSGRLLTLESLSGLFSDILRETYTEMLEDEKLVGVWTGRVSSTYVIRDPAAPSSLSVRSGK